MRSFSPRKAIEIPRNINRSAIAVLCSGGIQSAILLAHLLEEFEAVYPVYVRMGSALERAEEEQLKRFLAAIRGPKLGRLTILEKESVAAEDRARTDLLLERAAEWCAQNNIPTLAVGTLEPVSGQSGSGATFKSVKVLAPLAAISRASVLELGRDLPLQFTFSCSKPIVKGLTAKHCGKCLKCQTRKLGLAGIRANDRTQYADSERAALTAS
jgi:7-cyano-7-deazaguanine synthase